MTHEVKSEPAIPPWAEVERVNALKTGPAIFTANIQIIRAKTGKVEHYLLTATEDTAGTVEPPGEEPCQ